MTRTKSVDISLVLVSQMNSVEYLSAVKFKYTIDKTNWGQPTTKQCLILFSLCCKKAALAIKEAKKNTLAKYV